MQIDSKIQQNTGVNFFPKSLLGKFFFNLLGPEWLMYVDVAVFASTAFSQELSQMPQEM